MNDVIESLHFFEPGEQRTLTYVPELVVVPCRLPKSQESLLSHLPEKSAVIDAVQASPHTDLPLITVSPAGTDLGISPAPVVRHRWELFKRELEENSAQ